ncbi:hypothetical protein EDB83DRAFT_448572 [Lactarius deliciosus]|nr:hypothetical protein EDB83DRAFT_448572 [Lactarius deliciosus]
MILPVHCQTFSPGYCPAYFAGVAMALDSLASGPGGETEEAISLFAEGTFEHQVAELVGYISSGRQDTERAPYFESIRQKLVVEDSQNLQFNDVGRHCPPLFSHILNIWPINSSETKAHATGLFAESAIYTANPASAHDHLHDLRSPRRRRQMTQAVRDNGRALSWTFVCVFPKAR